MSTPGRRRITSVREVDCQRSISCRVTTLTGASTVSIGCATRFAVTTNVFELLSCAQPENAVTDKAVISEAFLIIVKASII